MLSFDKQPTGPDTYRNGCSVIQIKTINGADHVGQLIQELLKSFQLISGPNSS